MFIEIIEDNRYFFQLIQESHAEIDLLDGHLILNHICGKWQVRTSGDLQPLNREVHAEDFIQILSREDRRQAAVIFCNDPFDKKITIPLPEEKDMTPFFRSPLLEGTSLFISPTGMIHCENAWMMSLNGHSLSKDTAFRNGDCLRFLNVCIYLHRSFIRFNASDYLNIADTSWKPRYGLNQIPAVKCSFRRFPYAFLPEESISVQIKPPDIQAAGDNDEVFLIAGSSLPMTAASLTSGIFMACRAYMNGRQWLEIMPMLILPGAMMLSVLFLRPLQQHLIRKRKRLRQKEQEDRYIAYLHEQEAVIIRKKQHIAEAYAFVYPPCDSSSQHIERGMMVRLGNAQKNLIDEMNIPDSYACATDRIQSEITRFQTNILHPVTFPYLINLNSFHHITLSGDRKEVLMRKIMHAAVNGSDEVKIMIHQNMKELDEMIYCMQLFTQDGKRRIGSDSDQPREDNCIFFTPYDQDNDPVSGCLISFSDRMTGDLHLIAEGDGRVRAYYPHEKKIDIFQMDEKDNPLVTASYVPETLMSRNDFLSLYGVLQAEDLLIEEKWNSSSPENHLYARLGHDDRGQGIVLDLNEKGDGPHGLIAGMTGSGKSELILTMLLSLAVNYSPENVQFVLIDFKGGGCAQALQCGKTRLPHVAGILCNLDINEMDRALYALKNECTRRQERFRQLNQKTGQIVRNLNDYRKIRTSDFESLADLVIVIDEFAELKSARPDFMADLISIARIGRSLGMHLILCTQKPAGIVNEQIWANTNFKLCMKVAGRQDSLEVLHHDEAASLTHPGSFVLLKGDGILLKGKAGYAHAPSSNVRLICFDARMNPLPNNSELQKPQTEEVLEAVLRIRGIKPARKLWQDPPSRLTWPMFAGINGSPVGMIDDIYQSCTYPLFLPEKNMYIVSMSHQEKENFFMTLAVSLLRNTEKQKEITIIDDLDFACDEELAKSSSVHAVINSTETDRLKELSAYFTNSKEDLHILIITDITAFLAKSGSILPLETYLGHPEENHIQLILMGIQTASIPYRFLSLIRERWTLKNENSQDIGALLERGGRKITVNEEHGLINDKQSSVFRFIHTEREDLKEVLMYEQTKINMPLFFVGRREKGMSCG